MREPIVILSEAEIEKMRKAGRLAAELLHLLGEMVEPGISTSLHLCQCRYVAHDLLFLCSRRDCLQPIDVHARFVHALFVNRDGALRFVERCLVSHEGSLFSDSVERSTLTERPPAVTYVCQSGKPSNGCWELLLAP